MTTAAPKGGSTVQMCWRIRGRNGAGEDRSRDAWARSEVGVWYGSWSAEDWKEAVSQETVSAEAYLSSLPRQQHLSWAVPKTYVDTVRRFSAIKSSDWVVTCFDDALHFGRPEGPLQSRVDHPLNCGAELFKFRSLSHRKSFQLARLPDVYRLIPSAGRSNVYQYGPAYSGLVSLLAACDSEGEVTAAFRSMPLSEWLDRLGPGEWESLCLGYLIRTESYLPTGLVVGRTLSVLDIAGVNAETGQRIYAQCKKDPSPVAPEPELLSTASISTSRPLVYLFAYGGATGCPDWMRVVTRREMLEWLQTEAGESYVALWRQ